MNLPESQVDNKEESAGYPLYPDSEDIYDNFQKEEGLNPEDTPKKKAHKSDNVVRREALDEKEVLTGRDLDVPGSELDDDQEAIGSEDEENNYYSLGGDNHND